MRRARTSVVVVSLSVTLQSCASQVSAVLIGTWNSLCSSLFSPTSGRGRRSEARLRHPAPGPVLTQTFQHRLLCSRGPSLTDSRLAD